MAQGREGSPFGNDAQQMLCFKVSKIMERENYNLKGTFKLQCGAFHEQALAALFGMVILLLELFQNDVIAI